MHGRVDLILTCFERTYRKVLAPGFAAGVAAQNLGRFRRTVVVVNNVADRGAVEVLAAARRAAGEINTFHFVADRVDEAYRQCGLSRRRLGRLHYYSDHLLVAATLPTDAEYLLHWDADIRLEPSADWITPSVELMNRDPQIFTANPWWGSDSISRETLVEAGPFAVGYGFSDQVFLVRRAEISGPIYRHFSLASLRYPLAHIGRTFENRIDSYMRCRRRLRATYRPAVYRHPDAASDTGAVAATAFERTKRRLQHVALRLAIRCPRRLRPESWTF